MGVVGSASTSWTNPQKVNRCLAVPGHPNALVLPTLAAVTAVHVGGIGAVPEVVPAGSRQRSIEGCQPFIVGLGQSPDLV
jgi:hypothetical protein